MGLLTLLCLIDLLLSVICSVQHAPLTYKYYGGLFTLLHYLISAMVTLYCLYSCLYFNLVMFLVSLKGKKRSTALFGKQEQSPRQSSIAAVDGRKLIPVRENVEKVHSRDSCYNRGILMSFPSQFVNKIQKIVHHQGASNVVVFIFDICCLLQPVSSPNYALLQLPVIVLSLFYPF